MAQDILITPNRTVSSPKAEIKFVGSDVSATNRYFKVNAFSDVDFLSDSKTFVNFGGSSKSFTVYTDTSTAVLDVSDTGGTVRLGIDAAHKIIVGSGTPGARLQVDTMGDAVKGVIVKANSGTQSANLTEWQNSGGTVLSSVSATGVFSGDGSGLTTLNAGNISSGTLAVARGGTGTATGSITGTGALTFTAGGTDTNVNLVPNGTGTVDVASKRITNVATPTGGTDAANKNYVDAIKQGLDIKDSVRVATTANITLSGTQTIDGVAVIAGDRVLVKDQSTASGNGIYDVASGAWTRSVDADVSSEVTAGMFVFVAEGTTNADSGWVLTTNDPITLGTTSLSFTQFSGAGQITAGAGLTKTGNTLDVGTASSARIVVNADNIDLASGVISATGTYRSVTVDTYGRVTAGTNPTTFSGYGISDSSANLAAAITDETGTGLLVFNADPALTRPALSAETFSTTNNVTAGTNAQGQGALTSDFNVITTASSNPSGVTLPTATQGRRIVIVNKGANAVSVYPASGATIDALAANAAISLPVNQVLTFNASSTTQWYSSVNSSVTTGVTSFSAGTTGLTPNSATTGAVTLAGTLAVANGGTGLTSGTSGGILAFTASGTLASSGVLAASALVIGGGAGVAPSTTTTGTGVVTALGVNVGTAGAFVVNGGALGTPSSGTLTSCTGLPLTTGVTGTLPVANGGTGTTSGSITGTGALTFTAGGTNTNVNLVPNGTGTVDVASKRITNVATPTSSTDAANKAYVDATKQGLDVKDSVRVATTANITLSGTQTIDGVAVIAGDRVLVKDQTTASGNGIYDVAAGAWARSADADVSSEVTAGMFVFVAEGTANADSGWVLTTNDPITLGTTSLSFTQFSGAGQVTAGAGLTKTGNTIDAVGTANRITVNADSIDIASTYVGQNTITTLGTIATGTWQAGTVAVQYGGTGATTFTAGRILFGNGTSAINTNASLFWDNTNSRLGINQATPGAMVQIDSSAAGTKGLIVKAAATPTANLTEWQNSAGTNLAYMDSAGNFYAVSKSFLIKHPTKKKKNLRYACLEGPENGVYFRGKLVNGKTIKLPPYWTKLVDPDSITVTLTPREYPQPNLHVVSSDNKKVVVASDKKVCCDFVVYGVRVDIPTLEVEPNVPSS